MAELVLPNAAPGDEVVSLRPARPPPKGGTTAKIPTGALAASLAKRPALHPLGSPLGGGRWTSSKAPKPCAWSASPLDTKISGSRQGRTYGATVSERPVCVDGRSAPQRTQCVISWSTP